MILYISAFSPSAFHGGGKRSAQIRELVLSARTSVKEVCLEDEMKHRGRVLRSAVSGITKSLRDVINCISVRQGVYVAALAGVLGRSAHLDVDRVVWEYAGSRTLAVGKLVRRLFPSARIIALPHNVESFVLSSRSACSGRRFFTKEEAEALAFADEIYGISRSDQGLLSLMVGRYVNYLPYFPASDERSWLQEIRERRRIGGRDTVCLLGSAINTPTREGMLRIIEYLGRTSAYRAGALKISIVGKGVGSIGIKGADDNLSISDSVTKKELGDLLVRTKLVLIYRPPTTGQLTRVVDCLLAGIPVLINRFASDEWAGREGVMTYEEDFSGLMTALETDLRVDKELRRPVDEESRFLQSLLSAS